MNTSMCHPGLSPPLRRFLQIEPVGQCKLHRRGRRCDWPLRGACIANDGTAMPCCRMTTPDRAQHGNMPTEGGAADWHGTAYARFRTRLSSATRPKVCAGCAIYRGTF